MWVRIREQISMTDMMGGYDTSSDPEEAVGEAFCRQLEEASRSHGSHGGLEPCQMSAGRKAQQDTSVPALF